MDDFPKIMKMSIYVQKGKLIKKAKDTNTKAPLTSYWADSMLKKKAAFTYCEYQMLECAFKISNESPCLATRLFQK